MLVERNALTEDVRESIVLGEFKRKQLAKIMPNRKSVYVVCNINFVVCNISLYSMLNKTPLKI